MVVASAALRPGEVLLLTPEDVETVFDPMEIVRAVEEAFREKGLGRVQMPPKQYIFFEGGGDWRIMPAYIPEFGLAGVKTVGVNPSNREKGLPTVIALIELVDPETGLPLVVMDGTLVTAWRTGAAGAIAAKYMAPSGASVMGVVGAGVQGRMQSYFTILYLGTITRVKIYDVRREAARSLAEWLSRELGVDAEPVEGVEAAVRGVDILATCTPAREPIIRADWIEEGMHINAIGADAPGKEELDPTILQRARIVVDDYEQAIHSGEVNVPISKGYITSRDIYAELGEIVAGLKPGRLSDDEVTVFDSTGLAIQDVAAASVIYRAALERGLGRRMRLVKA
jgi:alanine dehydrogenase